MPRRYYLANCYPRVNDESAPEYEERLKRMSHHQGFSEVCAINFHTDCRSADSCHCLCHDDRDSDEQLRGRVVELLNPLVTDYWQMDDGALNETAQQIINLVRSTKP